ncbi:MAG: hypothetical protein IKT39_02415 [Clostridia bacterium]|nr:hypothetical protein [Clostridia bacterium]
MKDITFYDLNFNRLYILPQYTLNKGYISAYAQKDFNGVGSLEIVFIDDDLKKLIKQYRDNLVIEWNGFYGILCAYRDEPKGVRLTGESLNSILKRSVIPSTVATLTGNVEELAFDALKSVAPWLKQGESKEFKTDVSYSTDTYISADVYIGDLLKLDNAGYEIKPDFVNKQFVFEVLQSKETALLLSTNNKNAYDFSEVYINRPVAHGGWFPAKVGDETIWAYITLNESLEGVFKKDTVLKSTTETEAWQELKAMVPESETELKTRGITYGADYVLGDIVRVQNNDVADRKRITSVIMSQENGYIENPIFSEVE